MRQAFLVICSLVLCTACSLKRVHKAKNIIYNKGHDLALDVYWPRKVKTPHEVMIFVHGGSWRSGKKSLYRFFGKGMARKGLVGVVIDYRLSPAARYNGMTMDVAEAVKWVKENISRYNGDPERIFLSGHSAGGHLVSLVSLDRSYFDSLHIANPVKGVVLIDPFGLDMHKFLTVATQINPVYFDVFTRDTAAWKKGSPQFYIDKKAPPFLLFLGVRTYPAIRIGTTDFYEKIKMIRPDTRLIMVEKKRHAGMIFSYINPRNKGYGEILEFIHAGSGHPAGK